MPKRTPSRRATRADIFGLLGFCRRSRPLGACSGFSDTLLALRALRSSLSRLSVGDRQAANAVFVMEPLVPDGIEQLDLEPFTTGNLAVHGQRAAEHDRAGWQAARRIGELREKVSRREHPGHRPLLIQHALSRPRHVRTEHQPVPVRLEIGQPPQFRADRLGTHLLRHGDAIGFDLSIGVIGSDADI